MLRWEVVHGKIDEANSPSAGVHGGVQAGGGAADGGAAGPWSERRGRRAAVEVRPDLLRRWAQQADMRAGAAPRDVFPGQGRLPTEQDELRRLQRENQRLQQEVEFLKKASAYFARESR